MAQSSRYRLGVLFVIGGLAILALVGAVLTLIPGSQPRSERAPGENTVTAIAVVVAGIAVIVGFLVIGVLFLLV